MSTVERNTVTTTRQIPQSNDYTTVVEVDTTTTYNRQPDISDYITLGLIILVIVVGIIGFIKSVMSRRYYKCPQCGESFRSENMSAKTCKICGANLEETDDPNITDKTK